MVKGTKEAALSDNNKLPAIQQPRLTDHGVWLPQSVIIVCFLFPAFGFLRSASSRWCLVPSFSLLLPLHSLPCLVRVCSVFIVSVPPPPFVLSLFDLVPLLPVAVSLVPVSVFPPFALFFSLSSLVSAHLYTKHTNTRHSSTKDIRGALGRKG